MYHRLKMLLNVLAISFITVACSQTDTGISTKVKTNLIADETVKAAQIDIDVQNKIVTLSGSVDSQAVKERAISLARATGGVTEVIDNITIHDKGYGSGSEHGGEMMGRENRGGRDY